MRNERKEGWREGKREERLAAYLRKDVFPSHVPIQGLHGDLQVKRTRDTHGATHTVEGHGLDVLERDVEGGLVDEHEGLGEGGREGEREGQKVVFWEVGTYGCHFDGLGELNMMIMMGEEAERGGEEGRKEGGKEGTKHTLSRGYSNPSLAFKEHLIHLTFRADSKRWE